MPVEPDISAVDAAEQQAVGAKVQADSAAAPVVPGGLRASRVLRLADAVEGAVDALTGGEMVGLPQLDRTQVMDGMEQLPPEVWSPLMVLAGGFQQISEAGIPEAKPYIFDPIDLASSDAGLAEATAILVKATHDKALLNAIQKEAPPPAAPQAPPAAEPPPPDEMEGLL